LADNPPPLGGGDSPIYWHSTPAKNCHHAWLLIVPCINTL
jgi:hypothetical protein